MRRKIEVPTAQLEDTGVRSEDEVSDEECARLKRERVFLNESCTAKMLTNLRDSIHSDPESGLLYWVSRVYDDKNLRMTMCDRVLILSVLKKNFRMKKFLRVQPSQYRLRK